MNEPRPKRQRERLIAELAADLTPVSGAGLTRRITLAWLAAAGAFSLCAIVAGGPLRPAAFVQLVQSPRFALEALVGIAAVVALAGSGIRLSIPSMCPPVRSATLPLGLLAAWVALYAYGLHAPALEPSMLGKRAHCILETALVGVPALIAGFLAVRRRWPLHGAWSGLLLGLAAGAIPALIMQFACMYVPAHILTHHVAPGLSLGLAGALAGYFVLRPR